MLPPPITEVSQIRLESQLALVNMQNDVDKIEDLEALKSFTKDLLKLKAIADANIVQLVKGYA